MTDERYIQASEMADYVFCRRSWDLRRRGVPSGNGPGRGLGVEFHQQHGREVEGADRARVLAPWFAIAAVALGALALALR